MCFIACRITDEHKGDPIGTPTMTIDDIAELARAYLQSPAEVPGRGPISKLPFMSIVEIPGAGCGPRLMLFRLACWAVRNSHL